jgi:hypothetical protein
LANTRPQYLDYSQIFTFERLDDRTFKVPGKDASDAYRRDVDGVAEIINGLNRNNDLRVIGGSGEVIGVRVYEVKYDGSDTYVTVFSPLGNAAALPSSIRSVLRKFKGGNEGFIFSGAVSQNRPYFTFWSNSVDQWNTEGNKSTQGGGVGSFYGNQFMVFEGNSFGYGIGDQAVWLKYSNNYVSMRRNHLTQGNPVYSLFEQSGGPSYDGLPIEFEACFNVIANSQDKSALSLFREPTPSSTQASPNRAWIYRNTILGQISSSSYVPSELMFEGNVIFTDSSNVYGAQAQRVIYNDIVRPFRMSLEYLDSSYRLQGTARVDLFGTHGHEIAAPDSQ